MSKGISFFLQYTYFYKSRCMFLKCILSAIVQCLQMSNKSLSASCFPAPLASRCYSHGKVETDEEFDARWVTYFSKPDIDAWELRKGDFDTLCFSYSYDMSSSRCSQFHHCYGASLGSFGNHDKTFSQSIRPT